MRQKKEEKKLLAQARNLYGSGRTSNPAIHPRCQGAYHQLYEKEEALPRSTFVLRVCVSLILFLIFAGIDYEKTSVGTYDSDNHRGNYISATGGRILKVS